MTVVPLATFGQLLRHHRRTRDLTQEALADGVACSRHTIRKIEADERRPSRRLAERLLQRLVLPPAERDAFLAAARGRPFPAAPAGGAIAAADRAPDPGAPSVPPEVGSPPFVGRAAELAAWQAALDRAATGQGRLVVVEGEPGIGKTRLLREFGDRAAALGFRRLSARGFEIERTLPWAVVVELAVQAVDAAGSDGLRRLPAAVLGDLGGLLPELAGRVAVPATVDGLAEARQTRLVRALATLLDAASGGRPLLLAVDDLQWADDTSLQALHWLARRLAGRPWLMVLALRDEDRRRDDRLAAVVDALDAEPGVVRLALARLDADGTRDLVGDAALAERLHRETDGHPFFLVSLLQALRDGGSAPWAGGDLPLPEALRAALRHRLAALPAVARAVVEAGAVLGRRFEPDELAALCGEPPERVSAALDDLVARRLLRESDGLFDFAHDKLRETATLEIGPARRRQLHRVAAEVMAREGAEPARRAEHLERGGLWREALQAMLAAADDARHWHALRDALSWCDRAVTLAQTHPEALGELHLLDLRDRRGSARALAGHATGAAEDLRPVVEAARARGDRAAAADALTRLGMAWRRADRHAEARAVLAEALAEGRAAGDERRVADTLYHLGTVHWSDGRNADAVACHAEAVSVCERLGLGDTVAVQAFHGRGEAHFNAFEPRAAIACYERSIALATALGDRAYACENDMMIGYACTGLLGCGDYPRARDALAASLSVARQVGLDWHAGPAQLGLDHVRACTGSLAEAWAGMAGTLDWLDGQGLVRYGLIARDLMAVLALDADRPALALRLLDEALARARAHEVGFWRPRLLADRAIAAGRLGRPGAADGLPAALAAAEADGERLHAARVREALAEAALAAGDAGAAIGQASLLARLADAQGLAELGTAARWRLGLAHLRAGDRRAAVPWLREAHARAQALGRPRLVADVGSALAQAGEDPGPSVDAARRALQVDLPD